MLMICTYVCVRMHAKLLHIHIIRICTYVLAYIQYAEMCIANIRTYAHTPVQMYVPMHTYVGMYVRMYVCVCVQGFFGEWVQLYTGTVCMLVCTYVRSYVRIRIRMHTYVYNTYICYVHISIKLTSYQSPGE